MEGGAAKISSYENLAVQKTDPSEATITAVIPVATAESFRAQALTKLGATIEIPGFRKGHIPEKLLLERIGMQTLWEKMAELAIERAYPAILRESSLPIIGRPHVSVTKLAAGNPIEFSIAVTLEPEVTLPDYKVIAAEVMKTPDDVTVTDADSDNVIREIRTNKWRIDHSKAARVDGAHKEFAEKGAEPKEDELPELTDEMVKQLGDFSNISDFKTKLRENLKAEKIRKAKEKKRIAMGEKIIEGATIPLPRLLVESELAGMLGQFKADVLRMGMQFDEYLKRIQKTESDLQNEWKPDAERRAKLQLVLNEIAQKENIRPDEAAINRELEHLKSHMKDQKPDENRLRLYVTTVLTNELVFQFLEKQRAEN